MAVRFGELADYVYCTYCAALLLERMDRDRKDGRLGGNRSSGVLSLFTPKWRCADAASEDDCQEEGGRRRKRKDKLKRKLKRKVREQEAAKDKLYTCEITKRKSMGTHENQRTTSREKVLAFGAAPQTAKDDSPRHHFEAELETCQEPGDNGGLWVMADGHLESVWS